LQQVYELRQRTAKSEKWERERCRELSALLRLKLDERGVIGGGEGGDCSNHHSLSCCSDLPFSSSSPSSDSLTVYQPQPSSSSSTTSSSSQGFSPTQNSIPSSSPSSTLPSTFEYPHTQSQGPKHKIKSMSQLVASMLFHRQSDALRRHPSRKAGSDSTTASSGYSSYPHPSSMGGDSGMKMLSKRRSSTLSKVILPEELELELELDSEKERGVEVVETGDDGEDVNLDDGSLGRGCSDMDLDEEEVQSSSHGLTWSAPELCESRE